MEDKNVLPSSTTLVLRPQRTDGQVVHLKLKRPKNKHKQVSRDAQTGNNEHLNKKKSKCCCIYEKPKKFKPDVESNESDSDECDSCIGKMKMHQLYKPDKSKEEHEDD